MRIVSKRPGLHEWRGELSAKLEGPFREALRSGDLSPLRPPGGVADDAMKLLVKDARGRPVAVALCSPPFEPEAVATSLHRAEQARRALGSDLGVHVVSPLREGRFAGLSYGVLPFYQSLNASRILRKLQRMALAPRLFGWLREAARATMSEPAPGTLDREVVAGLELLAKTEAMPSRVRDAAETALKRLRSGAWNPRRVLMHGDLWLGNIMLATSGAPRSPWGAWRDRFVVIDWGTSRVDGLPFDDLIRIGHSLGVSSRRLRAEIVAHARLLGCEVVDARSYLAASLGVLGFSLNQFPFENYVSLARYTMIRMDEALAAGD